MSNVLIGIIGVILFIGLALAGALFLGPRFQESTINSKASAAVQAVSQVTQATSMYQASEGKGEGDAMSLGVSGLTPSYLKSVPTISDGSALTFRTEGVSGGGTVSVVGSNLSSATGNVSQKICEAINRQSTGSGTIPTEPTGTTGCFTWATDRYRVYSRL